MALGTSAMSNTAAEVIHSDVFLVTGSNTAETHPIIALQMKSAVANHGAKLIVVDPRRVEMVDWAALWLPENFDRPYSAASITAPLNLPSASRFSA
mgnify:CR=1 FL=1